MFLRTNINLNESIPSIFFNQLNKIIKNSVQYLQLHFLNFFSLITCGIVGLFLSPITVVLVLVFVLLEYGEQFKNSPGQILGYHFTFSFVFFISVAKSWSESLVPFDSFSYEIFFSYLLGVQDWSLLARYKFRDYNELPHLFEARMKKVSSFFPNFFHHSFEEMNFLEAEKLKILLIPPRPISLQLSSLIIELLTRLLSSLGLYHFSWVPSSFSSC